MSNQVIEFTNEELARVNSFEPQKMRDYLNELLTEKISQIVERIEFETRQKYCDHDLSYYIESDEVSCSKCSKDWV